MKTAFKQSLMWLVNRHLVGESLVTWAMKKFDLKGF
jgi:hypothetical protein